MKRDTFCYEKNILFRLGFYDIGNTINVIRINIYKHM